MEGNKSAMYEQAGRNRGWTQGYREEAAVWNEKQADPQVTHVKAVKPAVSAAPMAYAVPAIPKAPVAPMVPRPVMVPETAVANVVIAAPAAAVPSSVSTAPAVPVMPTIPAPPVVNMPEMKKTEEACQTLAMAYIPMQQWRDIYEPEQGISRGTIFAELDLPFVGEGACRHE